MVQRVRRAPYCTVADLYIYTPIAGTESDTGLGYPQEFMSEGKGPFDVTPEPRSMALMGTFLTLAGLALGKKKLFSYPRWLGYAPP